MSQNNLPKIVVIGGGTGSYVLLSGLKEYPVNLTAIVPVTDDGGSTGRLRDEFGFLPVGDIRQCLAALASQSGLLHELLLYRFNKGKGLAGHNLGNLILTALEDMVGSEPEAMVAAAKIFRLKGRVMPIANQLVKLVAYYSTGRKIISEHKIETHLLLPGEKITRLSTSPLTDINPVAAEAIKTADLIILAPGDLYNSIIANLIIRGAKDSLMQSRAKLLYVVNLMTLNSQTHGFTALDHVQAIEKYSGRSTDYIIVNNQPIPANILKLYQTQHEYPVEDDLGSDPRVTRDHLIAMVTFAKQPGDKLKRSHLRHDFKKLSKTICQTCL